MDEKPRSLSELYLGVRTQPLGQRGSGERLVWLARFRDRLETVRFTRFDSQIALGIAILVYFALTIPSAQRHLWHDELYTYYIAKAPSVAQLLKDVRLDLHPPLGYLSVRASLALFGDNEPATRLPFLMAFLIGSLCLYRFVAERLRPAYGLLAMLVWWSTPFFMYSTEARPYALVVAFFGIAMLAWERAVLPGRSGSSVVVLGLAVLGMMFSHFYTVFYIWPFCLAELWRWYRSRKFYWAIWAALLIPCVVPLFYLSVLQRYEAGALPPVQQASPFKIFGFFYHTLEPEGMMLLLAVTIGLIVVFRRERQTVDQTALMRPLDVAFTAGLLTLPVVLGAALMRTHGAFFPRYAIPALFAYGVLVAFFVAMYTNASRLAAAAACCVLLATIAGATLITSALNTLRTWGKTTAAAVRTPPLDRVRPELPLVAASGLTFLEMDHYESPATVARLYYLSDRSLALRYAHATIFEGGFVTLNQHFPIRARVAPYARFVAEHPHFLVVGTPDYAEDWLIRRLMDIHATLVYLGSFPIPYKDTQIFEVAMPGASAPGASAAGLTDADVLNGRRQFDGAQSAAAVDHQRTPHLTR